MNTIIIKLAKVNILVSYQDPITRCYLSEFETTENYQYEIHITNQRLKEEYDLLRQRFPSKKFKNSELENNVLYREIPKILIKENVIMLHGVLIRKDNEGFLFTAPSGTGKSTHANLWLKKFPDTVIINGDKPLLRLEEDRIVAYGSPWKGKENIGVSDHVELKSICHLHRNEHNYINEVTFDSNTVIWLLEQSHINGLEQLIKDRFSWFKKASEFISLYELYCNMDEEAVNVSFNNMHKES